MARKSTSPGLAGRLLTFTRIPFKDLFGREAAEKRSRRRRKKYLKKPLSPYRFRDMFKMFD